MKKIYLLFFIIGALSFPACEGPEGPPGIDGRDGEDGDDGGVLLSTVLEKNVTFTAEDQYQAIFGLEILEDDNLLIFVALGMDEDENVVWMPLPQTSYVEDGVVIYNYFFSQAYFSIFLESSIDPADLTAEHLERYFRIVIVPGQYASQSGRINYNDYEAVMKWLGKGEDDVQKIEPK